MTDASFKFPAPLGALMVNPGAPTATPQGMDVAIGLGSLGLIPVALLVFAIGLSLGGPTGYAINPARDFGPRLAHALLPIPGKRDSDWSYTPGSPSSVPSSGALLAAGVQSFLH